MIANFVEDGKGRTYPSNLCPNLEICHIKSSLFL